MCLQLIKISGVGLLSEANRPKKLAMLCVKFTKIPWAKKEMLAKNQTYLLLDQKHLVIGNINRSKDTERTENEQWQYG